MKNFITKTIELQIVLETVDPTGEDFTEFPTDLLWINYITEKIFMLTESNQFVDMEVDIAEFLKSVAHFHYKQVIICFNKHKVIRSKSLIAPSGNVTGRCLHAAKLHNGGVLAAFPTGIITANGSTGAMLILFQLLVRTPPDSHDQLIANIFNSQNMIKGINFGNT
jgi:hypothetical protein